MKLPRDAGALVGQGGEQESKGIMPPPSANRNVPAKTWGMIPLAHPKIRKLESLDCHYTALPNDSSRSKQFQENRSSAIQTGNFKKRLEIPVSINLVFKE